MGGVFILFLPPFDTERMPSSVTFPPPFSCPLFFFLGEFPFLCCYALVALSHATMRSGSGATRFMGPRTSNPKKILNGAERTN
jgi:hypothetical protein